jgi:Putative transmembrane protein (PGPGW).
MGDPNIPNTSQSTFSVFSDREFNVLDMSESAIPADSDTASPKSKGNFTSAAASSVRAIVRKNPTANKVYRTGVGVLGGTTVALGVVLMPLPGPGSLVALAGLGILSSEFEGAKKVQNVAVSAAKQGIKAGRAIKDRFVKEPSKKGAL